MNNKNTGLKPSVRFIPGQYTCARCGESFAIQRALMDHLISRHDMVPSQAVKATGNRRQSPPPMVSVKPKHNPEKAKGGWLGTKEHYDLMAQFEKDLPLPIHRRGKEPKELWAKSRIYQNGEANQLFLAYRLGYTLGKSLG